MKKGWTDKGDKGANWQPGAWGSAGQDDQGLQGTRPVAPTVSQPAGSGVITALRSHLQSPTVDEPNKYVTMADLKEVLSQYLGQSISQSNCITTASCNGKSGAENTTDSYRDNNGYFGSC